MQMLQEVDIFVVSDPDCEPVHNGNPHPSNICAGVPEGGQGHCKVIISNFKHLSLEKLLIFVNGVKVGIVSWSVKPCTVPPYPGVYTEASWYIDWFNANMNRKL
jgi:trypsin